MRTLNNSCAIACLLVRFLSMIWLIGSNRYPPFGVVSAKAGSGNESSSKHSQGHALCAWCSVLSDQLATLGHSFTIGLHDEESAWGNPSVIRHFCLKPLGSPHPTPDAAFRAVSPCVTNLPRKPESGNFKFALFYFS